jgi:hypothetical protein
VTETEHWKDLPLDSAERGKAEVKEWAQKVKRRSNDDYIEAIQELKTQYQNKLKQLDTREKNIVEAISSELALEFLELSLCYQKGIYIAEDQYSPCQTIEDVIHTIESQLFAFTRKKNVDRSELIGTEKVSKANGDQTIQVKEDYLDLYQNLKVKIANFIRDEYKRAEDNPDTLTITHFKDPIVDSKTGELFRYTEPRRLENEKRQAI